MNKLDIEEKRQEIFARDGYMCRNCGRNIYIHGTQCLAHGIHKGKNNLKKFGAEIVHSEHNLYSCCGGSYAGKNCNDALNVGVANEEKEAERIKQIIEGNK